MKKIIELLFNNKKLLVGFVFIVAFGVRLHFVLVTPSRNDFTDLNIYRESGRLINSVTNVYNFTDEKEIRNQLRVDSIAYNSYVSETQARWDFYCSGNLPLELIYCGIIDKFSNGSPFAYRIVFAFFDALLSALIAFVLVKYWELKNTFPSLILLFGIGALSPTLLLWGNIFSEDKGLQILFMLCAVYFAKEKKWLLSSVLLGLSIAFKGVGFLILPMCLFFIIGEPKNIFKIGFAQIKLLLLYIFFVVLFSSVWFIKFMPDVIGMIQSRTQSNVGINITPGHGSPWIFAKKIFPTNWALFKNFVIFIFTLIWSYTFIYKKLNLTAFSLFLCVLFIDLLLLQGSLDRMNVGIVFSMISFCFVDIRFSKILAWYTVLAGCFFYHKLIKYRMIDENIDALYATGYLLLFCSYPIYFYFKNKNQLHSEKVEIANR